MSLELRSLAGSHARSTVLVHQGIALTGDELNGQSDRAAAWLMSMGVERRSRVALLLGNTPEFVVAMLALMKLGASSVLLSTRSTDREIEDSVQRTGAVAILAPPGSAGAFARGASAPALGPLVFATDQGRLSFWTTGCTRAAAGPGELTIQFTSGVSGRSKIVPRTVDNLENELEGFASCLGVCERDATICPSPLFHTYGLINGFLLPFFTGRPAILVNGLFLPNELAEAVRGYRPGVLVGVPAMYKALSEMYGAQASDFASLRLCFSAGAPLPEAVAGAFSARYGRHIHQQYGSTETGVISVNLLDRARANPLAAGRAVPGREIEIVAEDGAPAPPGERGEVVVRSGATTAGYIGDPTLTAEKLRDGRYFTGDVGRVDDAGDLVLIGRRTSFINVGGLKVDPAEVERVLGAFDAVVECAVVPLPHASGGELVKAVVVARRAVTAREIQQFCRERLAAHKVPKQVTFVESLPRSATGKVLLKHFIS